MKVEQKNFLRNVAIILGAVALAFWFNLQEELEQPNLISEPSGPAPTERPKNYILALSWQPAFCETQPNKPECRSQREGRFDTVNFSLHGLWPQPESLQYCDGLFPSDVSWSRLPTLDLSDSLRRDLETRMPGYRSYLHRHEWAKHGSCVPNMDAEDYFRKSLELLEEINASLLIDYVAWNIGREVTFAEAAKQMDESFGKGAGERLAFVCKRDAGRNLLVEIRISLSDPQGNGFRSLAESILAAPKLRNSCKRAIIDRAGLQ